ncbi:MAG: patatin-like phospholipase family protein, partial [bacterium]
ILDVGSIRSGTDAWSRNRYAVGRIIYGPGEPDGVLVYLKASMTGREGTAILQYKASHQSFPHETTGDQFYGEDQFESYRSLGRDVVLAAFDAG